MQNFSLLNYNGHDGPHSSAPINIVGYQSRPHAHHHHIGSSLLGNHDLPGSPSNSIWTPSPDFDKLQPVTRQSPSNGMTRAIGQPLPGLPNLSELPPHMGIQAIKTVEEIEEEMKLQQNRPPPSSGAMNVSANECEFAFNYYIIFLFDNCIISIMMMFSFYLKIVWLSGTIY